MNLNFLQIITEADKILISLTQQFGIWIYPILFLIIFLETGFVIAPFLPGDSLLFTAGAIAALGSLNIIFLFLILILAAVLGDNVNYFVGKYVGLKALNYGFQRKYLSKTQKFYEKHGGKTIILARFMPFVRTFAPFVAGVGKMDYSKFFIYNIVGGILWVSLFLFMGFYFGNLPFIKENFSLLVIAIIIISILPIIIKIVVDKFRK